MPDPAVQLGATLGLFMRYGADTVRDAIAALEAGTATPRQQAIAWEFIQAVTGRV